MVRPVLRTDLHATTATADEVRCYAVSDGTSAARLEAVAALGALVAEV
jgi:hypothetical protein